METRIPVKEIMTRDVVTIEKGSDINEAAEKMASERVGSIVVTDRNDHPIGMITERDFIRKVFGKDKDRNKLKVEEIMTTPLATINDEMELNKAIRKMRRLNVKKLPVIRGGELIGIVTETDVLSISPEIAEILGEVAKIYGQGPLTEKSEEEWATTGICEECSTFSESLEAVRGTLLCEQCREESDMEV